MHTQEFHQFSQIINDPQTCHESCWNKNLQQVFTHFILWKWAAEVQE